MTSSEHSSRPGSIASRPPSLVPSRENSVSTPPTDLPQLPVVDNNGLGNKGVPAARTPSGSPPNLPQMPLPIPPMIRRVSQLSNAASSDSSGNSAVIKDDLPILQVLDQSGKEVIDPTLRDVPAPTTVHKDESEMAAMGNLPSMGDGQLPSLPLTQWPSLPSLNIYASGAGTDTQPSTQTSSPTSPNSLWPSSFGSYNNSLTDFGSSLGGDTPDKGLSENESDFDFGKVGLNDGTKIDIDNNAGAGVPAPKKKSHARKQPEGHIKRARNAFILFRKHITDSNLIPPSVEVKHQNISVVAAKMWKEAPLEVRAKFNEQARIEKEEHARKYPGYRYQPVFRRTDIIRRRVRKDPAEDEKVDAVAEALIKGKAGENLEKEIKDQIIQKGNESDSAQSEMSSSSRSRSRRRRDVGQLSKGAIRAQKAQARAKQMRQNLLGTNLLNMSLYNAATNRLANGSHAHQSQYQAQAQAQAAQQAYAAGYPAAGTAGYGMYPMDTNYVTSVGYDIDGRPIQMVSQAPTQGYPEMYGAGQNGNGLLADGSMIGGQDHPEMYRLPPIEGMVDINGNPTAPASTGYENWQAQGGMGQSGGEEYWDTQPLPGISSELAYDTTTHINPSGEEYYNTSYGEIPAPGPAGGDPSGMVEPNGLEYRLPPLMDIPRDTPNGAGYRPGDLIASQYAREHSGSQSSSGGRREERTSKEGQQTPSGHVLFNERLFDGALGTAGLTDKTKGHEGTLNDDDLGMFDQAMEQAGDIGNW